MEVVRDVIRKLFYADKLSFKTLEQAVLTDERLAAAQRRRAMNRLSFAQQWLSDDRPYEWKDLLAPGTLNVVDLRMQSLPKEDALRLCLVITDLVRRTRNGVNKMVVFDEAHEYVDCKELVGELENAITQIRHDGLSFVLASQFPEEDPGEHLQVPADPAGVQAPQPEGDQHRSPRSSEPRRAVTPAGEQLGFRGRHVPDPDRRRLHRRAAQDPAVDVGSPAVLPARRRDDAERRTDGWDVSMSNPILDSQPCHRFRSDRSVLRHFLGLARGLPSRRTANGKAKGPP